MSFLYESLLGRSANRFSSARNTTATKSQPNKIRQRPRRQQGRSKCVSRQLSRSVASSQFYTASPTMKTSIRSSLALYRMLHEFIPNAHTHKQNTTVARPKPCRTQEPKETRVNLILSPETPVSEFTAISKTRKYVGCRHLKAKERLVLDLPGGHPVVLPPLRRRSLENADTGTKKLYH